MPRITKRQQDTFTYLERQVARWQRVGDETLKALRAPLGATPSEYVTCMEAWVQAAAYADALMQNYIGLKGMEAPEVTEWMQHRERFRSLSHLVMGEVRRRLPALRAVSW